MALPVTYTLLTLTVTKISLMEEHLSKLNSFLIVVYNKE